MLRITRHEMTRAQRDELSRLFPGEDVKTVSVTLPSNTREAVAKFDSLAKDENIVEAVLPINILSAVLSFSAFSKRGGMLIRAVMERKLSGNEAIFIFDHYEVVEKVEIVTRSL